MFHEYNNKLIDIRLTNFQYFSKSIVINFENIDKKQSIVNQNLNEACLKKKLF